jgi:hypothetical protein
VRGDIDLHLRLLRRPEAVAGLVTVVLGATALAATYMPWYHVSARVQVLGMSQPAAVAHLSGWQAHPWSWLVPMLAVTAIGIGLTTAVDRPLTATPDRILLAIGALLAGAVAVAGVSFPPVERFDIAGTRLRELASLAGRLPDDIAMDFSVRPSVGLWLTLAAAALLIVAAVAHRER